jgi:putative membrane protein
MNATTEHSRSIVRDLEDAAVRPRPRSGHAIPGIRSRGAPQNPNLLRDRLANERTFLAWLRTGIAITGLGFVVARFDIFLQQIAELSLQPAAQAEVEAVQSAETTATLGVVLVLAGPVLICLAALRFWRTEVALLRDRPQSRHAPRVLVLVVAGMALVVGAALTLHIINTWPK